jgi:hypothetical protein
VFATGTPLRSSNTDIEILNRVENTVKKKRKKERNQKMKKAFRRNT